MALDIVMRPLTGFIAQRATDLLLRQDYLAGGCVMRLRDRVVKYAERADHPRCAVRLPWGFPKPPTAPVMRGSQDVHYSKCSVNKCSREVYHKSYHI